ncbi:GNAT family N-acetyltransferase [Photobacterium galatheae]|uniref:Acetyltransferase n=1 Tax=Photobacterium galatheae TaxID=1654360 RepID=A0A066RMR4_9GAMM|nr:GNAT family N-acetyltransferase [Photobacterium galatheae]KDM91705.1 acetyltransferase [Photobacterium galatheae]MCM0149816.1 GNAT family N-acetyltransferase [Photobacterium galatheae]
MAAVERFETCEFYTLRLRVSHLSNALNQSVSEVDLVRAALRLLTPKVTQSLPPEFQSVQNEQSAQAWVQEMMQESHFILIQIAATQEIIGFMFLDVYEEAGTQKAHLGYLLGEAFWGQGYASECLAGLIEWCRRTQPVSTLLAGVAAENTQSVRLLQKQGFEEATADAPAGVLFFERCLVS